MLYFHGSETSEPIRSSSKFLNYRYMLIPLTSENTSRVASDEQAFELWKDGVLVDMINLDDYRIVHKTHVKGHCADEIVANPTSTFNTPSYKE